MTVLSVLSLIGIIGRQLLQKRGLPISFCQDVKALLCSSHCHVEQTAFLVKGGHLPGEVLYDALALPEGEVFEWKRQRIHNVDTHGGGCTLSAAIAAALALGKALPEAAEAALTYVEQAMRQPLTLAGRKFLSHGAATP